MPALPASARLGRTLEQESREVVMAPHQRSRTSSDDGPQGSSFKPFRGTLAIDRLLVKSFPRRVRRLSKLDDALRRGEGKHKLARHMRSSLVTDALRMALQRRAQGADFELVHHSDAGSQYTSIDFTQTLTAHRVLQPIGSVGDAYDNAMAKSFFDSFKTELITDRVWVSLQASS
jgi:transposase InsO family protein